MNDGVRGSGSGVRKAAICLFGFVVAAGGGAQTSVLDDFASVAGWKAAPSEGVTLALSSEATPPGHAMRLDFDFHGHGGWAAVRKPINIELPANYAFTFRIRGEAPVESLEFKLVDPSGDNVWWSVRRDFAFPRRWQTVRIEKRQVSFAWGPAGGGELKRVATIELAVTAGSGGKGAVWISDLTFTPLPPDHPYTGTPVATASSSFGDRLPAGALTGAGGGWHSDPTAPPDQWLQIDFGERREIGGLVIDWGPAPAAFAVQASDDGGAWSSVWHVGSGPGGRSYVPMPDTTTRFVRILASAVRHGGVGVRRLVVQPPEFAATRNEFIDSVAKDARRGLYPRAFLGEMTSWALVGDPAPQRPPGLLGADGAFEPAPRTFSIEPFVWLDGALVTWADVATEQTLLEGYLPVPAVTWRHPAFDLEITGFGYTAPAGGGLLVRYRLTDRTGRGIAPRLFLAMRPLQVDPPSQFLNIAGGATSLRRVVSRLGVLTAAGLVIDPLTAAISSGVVGFDGGDVVEGLARGVVPRAAQVDDPSGWASAALAFEMSAAPAAEVWLRITPAGGALPLVQPGASRRAGGRFTARVVEWTQALNRTEIEGPPDLVEFARAMKANLAYILASRDGPALQPGTRSYARSWIRDGAMMAAALLRLGHADAVRDYLRWYAPFQFGNGRVPCCVDRRGADPVAENDSNGEFIFLAAEYLRFTGDAATVAAVWPHLAAATTYIDQLRQESRTDAYRSPGKLAFFGLLPASISHEGYSAKPMHSYWDDFWALRGLEDAVWLARALGHPDDAARWSVIAVAFRRDLVASVAHVREAGKLAYVPGCAELGDFDPTSTTVAFWPTGADADLPRAALEATYERYWREVQDRFGGTSPWQAYTPYEWRNVGAFVRLGWRERAAQLAGWLMADRMPAGWEQWPEIVWHDREKARFLGDLPHAWVGSDFIRSFLDMLAYERDGDGALVLGAGVPAQWLTGEGIRIRRLRTPYGELSFTMSREAGVVRVRVEAGLRVPSGGIALRPPLPPGPHVATVDGTPLVVSPSGELIVRSLPADVVIRPQGAATIQDSGRDDKGKRCP
ncbi:MAG TPA: discoidin domain-containing protein [Thermoanaerobaculaceae bacterium]|nr:discoidin domain-containing protein [Thermoanaerobaculaceae bacterium]